MNIEIDKLKQYLKAFQASVEPTLTVAELTEAVNLDWKQNTDFKESYHYIKLLYDQNLIEGFKLNPAQESTLGFDYMHGGILVGNISLRLRLTHLGHQTLETLEQSKFLEITKKQIGNIGVESVKLIPSLFIEMAKTYLKI
jgi:hypothetical protein